MHVPDHGKIIIWMSLMAGPFLINIIFLENSVIIIILCLEW